MMVLTCVSYVKGVVIRDFRHIGTSLVIGGRRPHAFHPHVTAHTYLWNFFI